MKFISLAIFAAALGVASADLQVTNPSSDLWWVDKSINVLAWTCKESTHDTFTVLLANSDPKILVSPIAIIGIQNNFDCSKSITQDMFNQPPGTGYTVILADTINNTNVYATSQPFEIKPLGAAYPTTTTAAAADATNTTSGAAPSETGKNTQSGGSLGLKVGASAVFAAAAAVAGLVLA
ncbi:hypothetical protein BXZ70DRAFT_1063900 [Cristinia sonorae]|uniref:Uncharacterized protein n=1 Tax=Cristinia sonorae TaxID=1940300 RepID=A0A8K0UQ53_9AGAR|nr:hypothetical protein BXZ70DRAFT_1063900 [Cristinia sonorae]